MVDKTTFGIAELAQEFGISARSIRFYEDKGLITPRREGLKRIYTPRDRVRLMLILRGKRLGFSLRDIQEIIDLYDAEPTGEAQLRRLIGSCREQRAILTQQREDIEVTLRELDAVESQAQRILDAGPSAGVAGAPSRESRAG